MTESDLDTRWPLWPDGEEGKLMLDIVLDWSVDAAFLQLYGGLSDLAKAFNEVASNKEYSTTSWVDSADAVQAAAVAPTPPPLWDVRGLKAGMLRRASYSGTMMGSKYRNEELHRLQEVKPSVSYRILTTVLTTAMHGEKFRPVVLTTLTALPDGRCQYSVRSVVLFIVKPNGFIKAMIDKGARDGQRKNFDAMRRVLAQFTTVQDAAQVAEQPTAAAPAAPEAPAPAVPAVAAAVPAQGLLESVVGAAACRKLEPWAALLHAQLAGVAPWLAAWLDARALLVLLALLATLSALRLVIDMLLFIHHASAHPHDTIGLMTHYVFKVVHVPKSTQEVLFSCVIFYTVRLMVNRLADLLPSAPAPSARATQRASTTPAVPVFGAGTAGGAAAAWAVGSPTSPVGEVKSEDQEGEGIKYEGYAEAIAAAQALPISPPTSGSVTPMRLSDAAVLAAKEPPPAAAQPAATKPGSSFMKGWTKSFSDAFTPSRSKKSPVPDDERAAAIAAAAAVLAGQAAIAEAPAGAPAVPGVASSTAAVVEAPSPTVQALHSAGGQDSENKQEVAQTSNEADSLAAAGVVPHGSVPVSPRVPATSPPGQPPLAVPRSLSESAVQLTSQLPDESPSPSSPQEPPDSSLAAELPAGAAMLPCRSVSPAHRQPGNGESALKLQTMLVEPSGNSSSSVTSLARKLRGVLSPSAQPASPRELLRKTTGSLDTAELGSPDRVLSPTAALREFRPSMPAHLAPQLAQAGVIEELFENQRLQPFRGWGHSWPGHFLPTDKVNHWSRREHEGFPVLTGPDFQAIAPPLPEGWQWCEEKWHVDLSGQIIDACDSEGWSYGLDFGYVSHPFQVDSGKKKISDFVRRRRWIRTRVPLELASQPRLTAIANDRASWSEFTDAVTAVAAGAAAASGGVVVGSGEHDVEAAEGSDGDDGVHAMVTSIFANVVACSEMQEALSQPIGSGSGIMLSIPHVPEQLPASPPIAGASGGSTPAEVQQPGRQQSMEAAAALIPRDAVTPEAEQQPVPMVLALKATLSDTLAATEVAHPADIRPELGRSSPPEAPQDDAGELAGVQAERPAGWDAGTASPAGPGGHLPQPATRHSPSSGDASNAQHATQEVSYEELRQRVWHADSSSAGLGDGQEPPKGQSDRGVQPGLAQPGPQPAPASGHRKERSAASQQGRSSTAMAVDTLHLVAHR